MSNKKKVVIAMSGGVDSSVAAGLLVKANYEVIGISLKLFDVEQEEKSPGCCGIQGIEDARTVSKKLGIPFYAINYTKKFREEVVKYFCSEYTKGRTPNPCIICNKKIKFGYLLQKAKELGADYIATGHYAKVDYNKVLRRYILRKGKDKKRDQSYFLFSLSQEQLKHTLFPLGDYTKEEVRSLAKEFGLNVHNKRASQDVCFITDADYHKFLRKQLKNKCQTGLIVRTKGEEVGKHQGIAFYTIGQRKGIGCHSKPMYVTGIDKKKNVIVIGEEKELYKDFLIAKDVNWIDRENLTKPLKITARIRYRNKENEAIVSPFKRGLIKVKFTKPQRAITSGQAVVFYNRDKVVGGGWIKNEE